MKEKLEQIKRMAQEEISALGKDKESRAEALEALRVKFLGKKGELTAVLRGMGALSAEERPLIGQLANEVRSEVESLIEKTKKEIEEAELELKLQSEEIDVTMPGKRGEAGRLHPITQVLNEMTDIFVGLGFQVVDGPEVEYDLYNFEKLNIPKNHPARDTQDTFYINENIVLRTQTSPVQVRVMENTKPPIRIVSPGRVYRSDTLDATHSPLFHQMEGLVVDKGVTMTDLKGTLELFAKRLYGENAKIKLRPHHFNFTEPSAEVDLCCFSCGGKGCRLCKGEGWIEILGAGMVHPKVLKGCGIDPDVYSGFAFGMGIERVVMGRFSINDIRLFYENDVRFLKQF